MAHAFTLHEVVAREHLPQSLNPRRALVGIVAGTGAVQGIAAVVVVE